MNLSHLLDTTRAALAAHPGIVAWLIACVAAIYRSKTPAQWVALGDRLPRLQGLLKLARGAGFEPAKVLEGAEQAITGKRVPDPREVVIASQAQRIADLQRVLEDCRGATLGNLAAGLPIDGEAAPRDPGEPG